MKKLKLLIFSTVLMAMCLGLAGCGSTSGDKDSGEEVIAEGATPLKASEIYSKIKSSYELPDMYEADADWLMNYYGIDAGLLSDYVFAEADEVHADRVIILSVADEKDIPAVEEKLGAVLGQLSSPEMLAYLPDQADTIKAASIKKQGNTIYLVISPDADGIEKIIKDGLLGK